MAQRLTLIALLGLLVATIAFAEVPAALVEHITKLTADDAEGGEEFGWSVALSGTTALVGAYRDYYAGDYRGSAYVFERDQGGAGNWGQVAKINAGDAAADDFFGYSAALSGTTALVGAYGDDDAGSFSGSAYVFERDQGGAGNWGQVAKITAADAAAGDGFGFSVALSGTTALVGASFDDGSGNISGSAYVFERDQGGAGNWRQVAKLTANDAAAYDQFGGSVALSGTTALVGAWRDDDGGSDSGSAYVFERDQGGPGNWGQVAKLTANDATALDRFGFSVALSGPIALVGAYGDGDGGGASGSAYVFGRDQGRPGNWGQVAKITADDAAAGDQFGVSVALSGTTALVGAHYAYAHTGDGAGNTYPSGSAYVFERDQGGPGNWGQVAKITPDDAGPFDDFGASAALSGTTALVGAHDDDGDGNTYSGSASVFSTGTNSTPHLQIPAAVPATATPVDVPVALTNGAILAATAFSINYDATCLDFDHTDATPTASPTPSPSTPPPTSPAPSSSIPATATARLTSLSPRPSCRRLLWQMAISSPSPSPPTPPASLRRPRLPSPQSPSPPTLQPHSLISAPRASSAPPKRVRLSFSAEPAATATATAWSIPSTSPPVRSSSSTMTAISGPMYPAAPLRVFLSAAMPTPTPWSMPAT